MTSVEVIGIGVISVTVIYTIIRFWEEGNLEKGTLTLFIGGMLVGLAILYFFYPPFQASVTYFMRNLWNLILQKAKTL